MIMADAVNAVSSNRGKYDDAVENLLRKLILDTALVGEEQLQKFAWLVDMFWVELNNFQNRTGMYDRDLIWISDSTSREDCEAHRLYQKYSLGGRTKCFGQHQDV